ncbi:MAG: phosphatidylcholine/phosphatidylserine synthase [Planctomycetota bacterium]
MKTVAALPTLLTLGNTFCGFLAIAKVGDALASPSEADFAAKLAFAAWMIFLAMIFDALDGRVARLTKASTDFGAQLDSLTDLVTFGVAPAFLIKALYERHLALAGVVINPKFILLLAVLYVASAALRLARFTLDTSPDEESHIYFSGLPSPAAAGVLAGCVQFYFDVIGPDHIHGASVDRTAAWFVRVVAFAMPLLGLLMVSKVRYVHVINRYLRSRKPFTYVVLMVFMTFAMVLNHEWVLFALFAGYALLGPSRYLLRRLFRRSEYHHHDAGSEGGAAAGT